MNKTEQLQSDVIEELAYDAEVDSSRIAVTIAEPGIVVLAGSVPTYTQRGVAQRIAQRVKGVQVVANELQVNPVPTDVGDTALAEAALRALTWSSSVPKDRIKVSVADGWITLQGNLDWEYQRRAATKIVSDLVGVKGVSNIIVIEPKIKPNEIRAKIGESFRRNAEIDAEHVGVEVSGGTVILRGNVRSYPEKEAAERTAWSAPGVISVNNLIEVHAVAHV